VSFSVQDIVGFVQSLQGRVVNSEELGDRLSEIRVDQPVSLGGARPSDLTFFFSKAFQHELPTAKPGILITGDAFVQPMKAAGLPLWKKSAVIACSDPYLAMALLSEKFAEKLSSIAHVPQIETSSEKNEVHPTAVISPGVELGQGVKIGPFCVIENGAKIGSGAVLYSHCYVGPGCVIGENSVLFPRVSLYEWTRVGNRVRIHSGSVLGSDGFGYAPRREGARVVDHQKIYHLGKVIVEDDVEIGSNCTVDRGTFGETRIGKKAKLDNLVHLGHNSRLDEGAIICGGTCLAGNASVGKFAYIGGLTGIVNHVHIGDGAMVGASGLVTKDVPPGGTAVGNPQREYKEHFRAHALLSKLLSDRRKK
jgi:UDP-3-O-[3-hydroxymyristoyl] glucosamine N-acyltransferase LpxD